MLNLQGQAVRFVPKSLNGVGLGGKGGNLIAVKFHQNDVALLDAVLLATGLNDCVHAFAPPIHNLAGIRRRFSTRLRACPERLSDIL